MREAIADGGSAQDRARALALCPGLAGIVPQLAIYETLLRRWQARINLVGPSTLPEIWTRHFADSAQLAEAWPDAHDWVDLGAGAGFPGLVVALLARHAAGRPSVTLVESDTRKAAFLREVSRETGADVTVVAERAEPFIAGRAPPDVVSSRAMAPVAALLRLTRPWLAAGTTGLFLVGRDQRDDADGAVDKLTLVRTPSRIGDGFVLQARVAEAGS